MSSNLKIKDIPESERPKEKLFKYGADILTNSEIGRASCRERV